ncbi:e3 ubiquitin-protein ligase bre1 [Anaeramoeba flamelloides]|uniref:E3 ubiquitin-protein ligase bre1 n=1 Tax=Anaeramoeba flamelloides TaxID=1746091 RepID=A0AAV7ZH40_9EUKA|nr:e3 ubiquitin-protein ligase bre1 [Anaeramoeba flamelloides]
MLAQSNKRTSRLIQQLKELGKTKNDNNNDFIKENQILVNKLKAYKQFKQKNEKQIQQLKKQKHLYKEKIEQIKEQFNETNEKISQIIFEKNSIKRENETIKRENENLKTERINLFNQLANFGIGTDQSKQKNFKSNWRIIQAN